MASQSKHYAVLSKQNPRGSGRNFSQSLLVLWFLIPVLETSSKTKTISVLPIFELFIGGTEASQVAVVVENPSISLPMQEAKRHGINPWVGRIPWSRKRQPTPVFLPGKFHGQRSLVGYSLRGCKELDTTEWLNTHRWNCIGCPRPRLFKKYSWFTMLC